MAITELLFALWLICNAKSLKQFFSAINGAKRLQEQEYVPLASPLRIAREEKAKPDNHTNRRQEGAVRRTQARKFFQLVTR
jgi:hypothetical protein